MNKKRSNSRIIVKRLLMLVVLVIIGLAGFLVWTNFFNEKPVGEIVAEDVKEKKGSEMDLYEVKKEKQENQGVGEDKEEKKVEQYDGDDPNNAEDLSGVVTYAGVSGDKLVIRVNIDQYLSSGQCRLMLVNEGVVIYNDTVGIVGSASTASCEGFDVPLSKIDGGDIEIHVKIDSENKSGTIQGGVRI